MKPAGTEKLARFCNFHPPGESAARSLNKFLLFVIAQHEEANYRSPRDSALIDFTHGLIHHRYRGAGVAT